jgi:hypothetical protein
MRDLFGRQHAYACRGELDGERDAVQAAADVAQRRRVCLRFDERRHRRLRALDEQLHRFSSNKRWDEPRRLTRDSERLTTRRHDTQLATTAQKALGERRTAVHDVLAVVENDERF